MKSEKEKKKTTYKASALAYRSVTTAATTAAAVAAELRIHK